MRRESGCVLLLPRALRACCTGLLALLVTTATPAAPAASSFTLFPGFAGRLLQRLGRGAEIRGFAAGLLTLGRLRPLVLAPVTPACVLLLIALVLTAAPAFALALMLLRLRALLALTPGMFSAPLIATSALAFAPLMAPTARVAITCGDLRWRRGRRALSATHLGRCASEKAEDLADD